MNEIIRCGWVNPKNEIYVRYHDCEWGVPVRDDAILFEMLLLECFQAGLSWECVLNKRENFRRAFDNFDWLRIAQYDEEKINALMQDASIIRHRLKIRAAVTNAAAFEQIRRKWGTFSDYLWHWTEGKTIEERGVVRSPLSDAISADLKKQGMKFVGSTVIYAYLQAVGLIDSHDETCFRHGQCR